MEFKVGMELNKEQSTQFEFRACLDLCDDVESVIEYLDFLKEQGRIQHLKNMPGLKESEMKLIQDRLA